MKLNGNAYKSYKKSGADWIGEIPDHWIIKKTKHLGKIRSGESITNSELKDSGKYEVFGGNGFMGYCNKFNIHGKNIIIGRVGALCGNVRFSSENKWISDNALILKLNKEGQYEFVYYLLNAANLNKLNTSNAQPLITGTKVLNLFLPIPPKPEQTAIANFLDEKTAKIDQAIAQKERMIELLQERKQIIIQNAVTKGLDPNVKMKDSGVEWIGGIPEHWDVDRNYSIYSESKREGKNNLPILSVSIHSAVSNEEISGEDNIQGRNRITDKSSYKLVYQDDIVFNMMRAWQGAIGAVRVKEGLVSPAYIVATPKTDINPDYIEFLFRTDLYVQQINRFSKGITDFRKRLYWDEFKNLNIIIPPLKEQASIANYLNKIIEKTDIAANTFISQIEKLKEYKTTLIDHAVTGKIKVS